ncbi:MAG: hypothetical protein P8126_00095 [Gammaproteobacteria bacterium]
MNNDKKGEANGESPRIQPTAIKLTSDDAPAQAPATRGQQHYGLWLPLLVLLALVAGVVFLLPRWVGPVAPPVSGQAPADAGPGAAAPAQSKAAGASPWTEAQQAELRKQSQDVLAKMLDLQEELKKHGVKQWAGDAYDEALKTAKQGDAAYSEEHFQAALDHYRQSLSRLQDLRDGMDRVFQQALQQGQKALADGDSARAQKAFATALLIRPGDGEAQRGQQRAGTLDQVNGLIRQGDEHLQDGKLEEAKSAYARALQIDRYADRARQGLDQANQRLQEREFQRRMSAGYAALDGGRLDDARKAFNQALKIKPGASDARAGLEQAEQRLTNSRIKDALAAAHKAEAGEDWQGAIKHYQAALSLDATLASAHQGLANARRRADLDRRLASTLANPLRLADDQAYAQAKALGREALAIDHPGPRLKRQIAALVREVKQARVPKSVTLRSDNQTHVIIYKVGDMGQFAQKTVQLTPGHYVAVGSRTGYRDVRVEFTVRPDQPVAPVVVQVSETINAGE